MARSNLLAVMRILEDDTEEFYEVPLNDQILNIVRVPTEVHSEKAGKMSASSKP